MDKIKKCTRKQYFKEEKARKKRNKKISVLAAKLRKLQSQTCKKDRFFLSSAYIDKNDNIFLNGVWIGPVRSYSLENSLETLEPVLSIKMPVNVAGNGFKTKRKLFE